MRIGGKKGLKQRPEYFRLDATHPLARDLVFAGLGFMGSNKPTIYHDSVSELRAIIAANHGTQTNMDPGTDWVWVQELGRWGLDIDATNDKVLCGTSLLSSASAFSMGAWFKLNSTTGLHVILGRHSAIVHGVILVTSGTNLAVPINSWPDNDTIYAAGLTTGTWHHGAVTQSGTNQTLYINGTAVNTRTNADTPTIPAAQFCIGEFASYTGVWPLNGQISDPFVADRALSPSEISILADRSDPMLGGLILPPRRRLWGAVSVTTNRRRRLLLGAAV